MKTKDSIAAVTKQRQVGEREKGKKDDRYDHDSDFMRKVSIVMSRIIEVPHALRNESTRQQEKIQKRHC